MRDTLRLMQCNLSECEAICCSDGAFLQPEEVRRIRRLVRAFPEHFSHLPPDYIVEGEWAGYKGPQTNVRPHVYAKRPKHFNDTRCVFAEADGKCSLQTLAVARGKHKWAYKPMGCWLFPLTSDGQDIVPPPRNRAQDPNNIGRRYPGFAIYTGCGKHRPDGKVWWIVLKEEVERYRSL